MLRNTFKHLLKDNSMRHVGHTEHPKKILVFIFRLHRLCHVKEKLIFRSNFWPRKRDKSKPIYILVKVPFSLRKLNLCRKALEPWFWNLELFSVHSITNTSAPCHRNVLLCLFWDTALSCDKFEVNLAKSFLWKKKQPFQIRIGSLVNIMFFWMCEIFLNSHI